MEASDAEHEGGRGKKKKKTPPWKITFHRGGTARGGGRIQRQVVIKKRIKPHLLNGNFLRGLEKG